MLGFTQNDPIKFCTESQKSFLKSLKEITPDAALLSCCSVKLNSDQSDSSSSSSGEETDTAYETEENSIPELLTSFFDPCSVNYSNEKINELGLKLYNEYKFNTIQKQYENLTKITSDQSISDKWMLYRAGRITSSVCKKAFTLNIEKPAVSTINVIMQYNKKVITEAMKYGKENESLAFKEFERCMKTTHINFILKKTGLHINSQFPYIGASPDGISVCDCHGEGLLEIKCPFNYRKGLSKYIVDKKCPVTNENKIKKNHEYYYQMQLQMLVTDTKFCHFYVWTNSKDEKNRSMLVHVEKDEVFCNSLKEKFEQVFLKVLLPELITRKLDPANTEYQKLYCYCNRPSFEPMIACDDKNCKLVWYHLSLIHI